MSSTLIHNARVLTLDPSRGETGIGAVDNADVLFSEDGIRAIGPTAKANAPSDCAVLDAKGRVLMPSFIDAHTHACWAGDRLDEWERKQAGATYLEILESGGGIMSTVRAVRKASQDELSARLLDRLNHMLREGTTTVEVKSGYGLSTEAELKILRAIMDAALRWPGSVVPTACIGHAIDPDQDRSAFVQATIEETLEAIHAEFPAIAVDAYCETGAWTLDETARLFDRAIALGHPIRVHSDQFNDLGMTDWARERGALSVDHLEAATPGALTRLAASDTFGVMLPCSGFHVDGRYADGRSFLDAGGKLVVATNCNPGSAPTSSMPFAIALAVRHLNITAAEAIVSCTRSAAALLGWTDRGMIVPGMRADLILLRHTDERQLGYEFGGNPVERVWCDGKPVQIGATGP